MVNQSNMEDFFRKGGLPIKAIGELIKHFYSFVFRKVDRIIIPDFPMPYTVCRLNLAFETEITGNIFFSGPWF